MPTVPYVPKAPSAQPIDETFVAMAAAELHEAGMLFEATPPPEPKAPDARPQPIR